jgi:glucan biosynthesis protein C
MPPARSGRDLSGRDLSIDYLRTTLTLMVLAHHSSLAYTSWAHFDREHIFRSTAPVVDGMRWAFFDYAENFNDVFFMSLMFFVSGLFVYPAIRKHGAVRFIRDRFLRLGVPFAFAVLFLMPIAYYASSQEAGQLSGQSVGFVDFYGSLARRGFPAGPPWFIWVLLLFDVVVALLLAPFAKQMPVVGRLMEKLKNHALATFAGMFVLAALVYLPLLKAYGFGAWTVVFTSPFAFQICRIGLYALWFVFGLLVGVPGFANGFLSRDGGLARRWPLWVLGCVVAYNALWFVPKLGVFHGLPDLARGALEALLWVGSCVASSFGFLAFFRGVELKARPWMLSLCRAAYVMYLVHYVYVLWMQRLLIDAAYPAALKFGIVFGAAVLLSWGTAEGFLRVPGLKRIL